MVRQLGTCYLTLMHKDKQKVCKFLVVQERYPALLSIPDVETLGVLTINNKTIGRQLASGDSAYNRHINCQCTRAAQTEGRKLESCTNKR